jgi:mannose-6-phosphate isomerase-like protein (cupin superfamily)
MLEKIDKPWGYEIIWAKTEQYVGKMLKIFPNCKLSLQYHEKKVETIFVNKGVLELTTKENDELKTTFLFKGQSYHIPVGTVHRFACAKDSEYGVELFEVSTTELDDVVRLQDDYGRK